MTQSISELESFATRGLNNLRQWAFARKLAYGMERSVRWQRESFETRRGLFSFSVQEVGSNAIDDVVMICRSMHVPERLLPSLVRFFPSAAFVHFGFEHAGDAMIGKCYLELPSPATNLVAVSGRLQFLGFKWSMNDRSVAVVTRYRTVAVSSWDETAALMLKNTGDSLQSVVSKILNSIQPVAVSDVGSHALLEVEEEGSDRRSYDLNLYDLRITVSMLAVMLREASVAQNVNPVAVDHWLQCHAATPVGHLACGLGRDQQSFLTVYYAPQQVEHSAQPVTQ